MKIIVKYCLLLVLIGFISACSKNDSYIKEYKEKPLVKIRDKVITVPEFYERAEYTVRPNYVKGNTNIDKKIILNSLIAEKLLTIENEGNSEVYNSKRFKQILKGRKEQLMRKVLFQTEGVDKVKLRDDELKREIKLSGRTYEVYFINIPQKHEADYIKKQLFDENLSIPEVWKQLTGKSDVPVKSIPYNNPEMEQINKFLFGPREVKVGDKLGPFYTRDSYLFIEVKGWNYRPAISDNEKLKRETNAKERLTTKYAVKNYAGFIKDVMKGKKVEFEREPFIKLAKILAPNYMKSVKEMKKLFLKKSFEDYKKDNPSLNMTEKEIKELEKEPLLKIDDKVWTVGKLKEEMAVHPLVFREKQMDIKDFPEQLKYAIVDLIRDKYLTDVCYKRGYDKYDFVTAKYGMWEDALVSLFERDKIIENADSSLTADEVLLNVLNPYFESLFKKYSDEIFIDVDEFNKIKLTNIDMIMMDKNVPYPVKVPAFPQLTTKNSLNYGNKMEKKK